MAVDIPILVAFNRGIISKKALARVDIDRVRLSAEEQTNWMPRVLGNMSLRPGTEYIGSIVDNNPAIIEPFIYAADDSAILEFTDQKLRIWSGETEELIARGSVTAPITNGTFTTDLTGWTDADESGAASAWVTGSYMGLTGTGFAAARRRQQVTTSNADELHAIRISVSEGPVRLKVGSSVGLDDYLSEKFLRTGTFTLSFTPAGNFWVEVSASNHYQALISSISIEASGNVEVTAPWAEADLNKIRMYQSYDVVFVAAEGYPPYRIERYSDNSWGIAKYQPTNGPMQVENVESITITPSALNGNITLTASKPLFKASKIGALYSLTSFGQQVEATFTAEDQFSDPIRVTGTGNQRIFSHVLSDLTGTSTTVTLQRSVNEPGAWIDITNYTTNGTRNYDDGLDNQIMYYRLGVKTGNYSSGTIGLAIDFATSGTITGYARVTAVASSTSASAIVLKALGGTDGTSVWAEGEWSDDRGWPTAVGIFEGRLWWFGQDRIWGSASDAFDDFDFEIEGDSGPISRNIAEGSTKTINWMIPAQRLLIGGETATYSIRSSSLDEPITPTAFSVKKVSTQGSAAVPGVLVDQSGYYVQRNGRRLYELTIPDARYDYIDQDVSVAVPEIGKPSIIHIAVQRQPDTRLHCTRSDGKVAVLVADRAEDVRCFILVELGGTDAVVERVVVLPGTVEDRVFYLVKRTIEGSTVRYLEKWATEEDIIGAEFTALSDSFYRYSGAATNQIYVPHLEGESVVVWTGSNSLDDVDGTAKLFTVVNSYVTLPEEVTECVVGVPYRARYKSTKLPYAAYIGTSIGMRKRIPRLGFVLENTHHKGLRYGPNFDVMDELPAVEEGAVVAAGTIYESYDMDQIAFPGEWSPDARFCLEAASPRPATVLATTIMIVGHRGLAE